MAGDRHDRLERLTNLVLVLLDTTHPLSLREITATVDGYPDDHEPARQAFERDKRALRELGIPISVETLAAEEQLGYRIRPDEYFLPDLDLDEAEANALAFAVAAVHLGGNAGRDALSKLGHSAEDPTDHAPGPVSPVAILPSLPALGTVHEALRTKGLLSFAYHGRGREVEPYGLTFRNTAWYLVARDRTAVDGDAPEQVGAMRTFRVDRFEDEPTVGPPGAFEPPADLDLRSAINLLPFPAPSSADVPVAELTVDGRLAKSVETQVPLDAVIERHGDGSISFALPVGDVEVFVSFVLGLGDTAVVTAPPELVGAVTDRLELLAAGSGAGAGPGPVPAQAGGEASHMLPFRSQVEPEPTESTPAPHEARQLPTGLVAGERLRRLLAVLVHLARVGEAGIAEVAARFDMGEDELVHDLELAACCGVPPYTPDQLIELIVDGDRVIAYGLGHLAKPRQLTPEEGFALAAAAGALIDVAEVEQGPLRSALSKLERALGQASFSVDLERPEHLAALQAAAARHESVEIDYFSSAATKPTARTVDPYQVVLREGRWYLDGYCHSAGDLRRFQVDRVQGVRPMGAKFEPPPELDEALVGPGAFLGGPDAVRARVAYPVGSGFGVEQVAASPIELLDDGRLATDVLVGDAEGWFGRLLLRLGPGTEVLSPPELTGAVAQAARRALRRYGADSGPGRAVAGR